jgi:hypothetical protein
MLSVHAQEGDALRDSVRTVKKPTGVRIGTDLIVFSKNFFDSPLKGWEANADIDFGRYYLTADLGSWQRKDVLTNGNYRNDGRYFRVGVDINFLLKDPDKNMFFIGFRYARASYNEHLTYQITTDDFDIYTNEISNMATTAAWGEMTTGLRVKIWKYLWMGYTARMKFLPAVKNDIAFKSYDVPGFGRTTKDIYWGFNYQIFWKIPFAAE